MAPVAWLPKGMTLLGSPFRIGAVRRTTYGLLASEPIAPELVDMTRAEPMPFSPAGPARGPLSPDDPSAPNYAPSGSFGDPTLATPDKGSRVLTAILADMVEAAE